MRLRRTKNGPHPRQKVVAPDRGRQDLGDARFKRPQATFRIIRRCQKNDGTGHLCHHPFKSLQQPHWRIGAGADQDDIGRCRLDEPDSAVAVVGHHVIVPQRQDRCPKHPL
mgnify:CR=1 FL=1